MAEVYLDAAFGNNRLERNDGSGGNDYPGQELSLGVRFLRSPWDGSFLAEIGYNRLSGDDKLLGSSRDLFFSRIGYRQSFLRHGFVAARAGTGVNRSRINFGEGTVPLPRDYNLPLMLSVQAGGEYCFGRTLCVGVFAAPFYEARLFGRPDYRNHGVLFGIGFSFDLARTAPHEEYEAVARDRDNLRWERDRLGGEIEATRKEAARQGAARPAGESREVSTPCPSCPPPISCPSSPPEPSLYETVDGRRLAGLLVEDPVGSTVILFSNESNGLPLQEDRVHRDRTGWRNPQLELIVYHLLSHPAVGVRIHGHANETGPEGQNRTLSQERGDGVARYLRQRGVPERQIVGVIGHGSSAPVDPDHRDVPINRAVLLEEVPLP